MIFELLTGVCLLFGSCSGIGIPTDFCPDKPVTCQCGQQPGNTIEVTAPQCAFIYSWEPYCHPCERGNKLSDEQICSKYLKCQECEYGSNKCSTCPQGSYGDFCEQDCKCQNGGQCQQGGQCLCPSGYQGAHCQSKSGCKVPPVSYPLSVTVVPEDNPLLMEFSCPLDGHILEGHSRLVCENGIWNQALPTCVPACRVPATPENGELLNELSNTTRMKVGHYVGFQCKEGYAIVGTNKAMCMTDTTWSHDAPRCVKFPSCGVLVPQEHARHGIEIPPFQPAFTNGTKVTVFCTDGYETAEHNVILCEQNGRWSSPLPTCHRAVQNLTCNTSGDDMLGNGKIPFRGKCPPGCAKSNATIWGTVVYDRFSSICKAAIHSGKTTDARGGYVSVVNNGLYNNFQASTMNGINSERKRHVSQSFRFHHDQILEKLLQEDPDNVPCEDPGEVENGFAELKDPIRGHIQGSTVMYRCQPLHVLRGTNSAICGKGGTWSSTKPICQRIAACLDPSPVEFGSFSVLPPLRLGNRYRIANLTRPMSRSSRIGVQITPLPKRLTKREVAEDLPNGHHRRGTRVRFQCASKYYKLFGSSTQSCLADGSWSGRPVTCQPVCGRSEYSRTPFVRYGNQSVAGQWPWHVGIKLNFKQGHHCGGTLLNEFWVMTAAHCLTDNDHTQLNVQDVNVFAGKIGWNNSNERGFAQFRKAAELLIHEDYNPLTLNADIALVRLANPVRLTPMVQPVCLPAEEEDNLKAGKKGVVTGWGQTEKLDSSTTLLHGVLPVVPQNECNEVNFGTITDTMFCAGSEEDKPASDIGDSGGGLVFQEHSADGRYWVVEGVVSSGSLSQYGVFTNVRKYISWILQYV